MKNFFKTNVTKFILSLMLCISTFALGMSIAQNTNSNTQSYAQTVNNIYGTPEEMEQAGIVFNKYTLGSDPTQIHNHTQVYNGKPVVLKADVSVSGGGIISAYYWVYSKTSDGVFEPVADASRENQSQINITNHAESGYYKCVIQSNDKKFIVDGIEIIINQKPIVVDSLSPVDKEYDGKNVVELTAGISQEHGLAEGDNTIVKAFCNVSSADVGEKFINKDDIYVKFFDNEGKEFTEETSNYTYTIDPEYQASLPNMKANITKKIMTLQIEPNTGNVFNWESANITYNGKSHLGDIRPFYFDINKNKKYLSFKILSATPYFGLEVSNMFELKNAGQYTLQLFPGIDEYNYDFSEINNITFSIERANPTFKFSKHNFTYNGFDQDISKYVSIDNKEQVLTFQNASFKNVSEGIALIDSFLAIAPETENYKERTSKFENLVINKADPIVDDSEFPVVYRYNNASQLTTKHFDKSKIILNNNEQTIQFVIKNGLILKDATLYHDALSIYIEESDNYVEKIIVKDIEIVPYKINTSLFSWTSPRNYEYDGENHEVKISWGGSLPIRAVYENNVQSKVGTYVASVQFFIEDSYRQNYEIDNKNYPDNFIWSISKANITKPKASDVDEFVYDGKIHNITLNGFESKIMTMNNIDKFNVGFYDTKITLKDTSNYQWADGTDSTLIYSWRILPAKIKAPAVVNHFNFDSNEHALELVNQDSRFEIVSNPTSEAGKYTAKIILKDNNYQWEGKDYNDRILDVDWTISSPQTNKSLNIAAIIIVSLSVVCIGIFVTLQFTVVKKHKRPATAKKSKKKDEK